MWIRNVGIIASGGGRCGGEKNKEKRREEKKNTNTEIGPLIKKHRQSELNVDAGEGLHSEPESR